MACTLNPKITSYLTSSQHTNDRRSWAHDGMHAHPHHTRAPASSSRSRAPRRSPPRSRRCPPPAARTCSQTVLSPVNDARAIVPPSSPTPIYRDRSTATNRRLTATCSKPASEFVYCTYSKTKNWAHNRWGGAGCGRSRLKERVEAAGEVVVVDVGPRELLQQRVQRVLHLAAGYACIYASTYVRAKVGHFVSGALTGPRASSAQAVWAKGPRRRAFGPIST